MSDIFKLPMICEDGDGYIYSQDCRYSINFDDTYINCFEQKSFVANAINSHDKLTEQNNEIKLVNEELINSCERRGVAIKQLTEQSKLLRAELNNFIYLAAMLRNGCKLSDAQYTANQLLGVGACGNFDKYEHELLYAELVGKYMTKIDAKTIEAIK